MLSQVLLGGVLAAGLPRAVLGASFSVPAQRVTVPGHVTLPPVANWKSPSEIASTREFDDQGFWFANFTVGARENLILLIDSGSTDVYLNPGIYTPSSTSQNLNENFTITFETTNPDGSGTETISGPLYEDIVALDGTSLTLPAQILGTVTDPVSPPSFPHDGLVGFAGLSQSAINSTSWFQHICDHGLVDECRFGLAFETDDTGVQYFGYVDEERFYGDLSVAPVVPNEEWASWMDIAYDGKVIEENAWMVTDSGTTIIFGPIDSVQKLFDTAGIQSVLTEGSPSILTGYFSCSNPPTVGFGLPSTGNATEARATNSKVISHKSTIFNILPSQLVSNQTGDNCTSSIVGTDEFPFWLVGQVFFQGKYVDHNHDAETMGFAYLAK